ncbi:hypothetical protein V8C42DRAFT_322290 [Trichoderma barbatum]
MGPPPPPLESNFSVTSIARRAPRDKAQQLRDKKGLPNMHVGLHLAEVADEYEGCRMVFTLQGEDKHKEYKADI